MTLLDDMLALLPDNNTGEISAEDLRTIVTDLYNAAQPIDSDLTTIAGLTATTNNFLQSKSSAWASRTPAQVAADLQSLVTITESQVTNLTTDLAAKQPLDSDLTTIAGLTATTDSVMQAKAGAWAARTLAQLMSDLAGLGTTFQPLDSDLTTIAGLTATTDNFMVGVSSAWASRTPSQAKTSLALVKGDVGLGNVDNTADTAKPVSTAQQTAIQSVVSSTSQSISSSTDVGVSTSGIYDRHVHLDLTVSSFAGTSTVIFLNSGAISGDTRSIRIDYTGSSTVNFRSGSSIGTFLGTLPTTTGIYWVWSEYSGTWSNVLITPENLLTQLSGKQPLDSDLTTIAGLTATTDNFLQAKSSAWASRTPAQVAADIQSSLTITESQVTNLTTDLAAKQPLDSDLTTIAGLTATTDSFMQAKGSAWSARTVAQVLTDLAVPGTTFQPLDSDLTTIAGLTATTDSIIQSKGSAWSARTMAQLLVDLAAVGTTFQPLDSDLTTLAGLTATTDNFIVSVSSAWASRTPAQVKTTLAIAESDVSGLVSDLAAKAPLASPALTGTATAVDVTLSGRLLITPDTLTDAATITVDAALGNDFTVTLGGNRTLGNPSNSTNGQKILFAIRQDGTGSRTLTLDTNYRFGSDITSITLSTGVNKTDYLGVRYNGTDSKWDVISFVKGY